MVFGNQLIDFSANGMKNVPLTSISELPTKGDIGQPPKLNAQEIVVSESGWVFTIKLENGAWSGCGPNDEKGNLVDWGVCVSYAQNQFTEKQMRKKLREIIKEGQRQFREQQEYQEKLSKWEEEKTNCENQVKEGSIFRWVNRDRNDASDIGSIDEDWSCLETITAIENEVEGEATPDDEEGEEDDEEVSTTTVPVVSSQSKNKISIGFGSGFKDALNKGLLGIGILVIGYGAYKVEERSSLFSNLFKKIVPKKDASYEGKKNGPQKA